MSRVSAVHFLTGERGTKRFGDASCLRILDACKLFIGLFSSLSLLFDFVSCVSFVFALQSQFPISTMFPVIAGFLLSRGSLSVRDMSNIRVPLHAEPWYLGEL